jgi:hypothetical protein
MPDHDLYRSVNREALQTLPRLTRGDRDVLERLLWLAPDVAVATAAAVVRTHQPELHDLLFAPDRERKVPPIAYLARAIVYLGLAMAAPVQGRILPILTPEHLRQARIQAHARFALWSQPALTARRELLEAEAVPDAELRAVLGASIEKASQRVARDPAWLRAVVYSEAGALYAVLAEACERQFGGAIDLESASASLQRISRTRDLLADALAVDATPRTFDPSRQRGYLERLRRFGWQEHVASSGRTLREIAAEAVQHRFRAATAFALSEEWESHGAGEPTGGRRYFIRPALLPESGGLALWAQEQRLEPLQKMLGGDPAETGLRLRLASVELLLEYTVRTGQRDFLDGRWTRTSNKYDGMQTRFGGMRDGSYAITLFPGARLEESVGVCPVIEVAKSP